MSSAVATEVVARFLGDGAGSLMAAALAMSVFGSLQVTTLASARIPYAMAGDGLFFPALATLSARTHVPVRALIAQGVWGIVLVFSGSYDTLTDYAIFAVLIFVALATASVFVFRRRMPDAPRAYRTIGCITSGIQTSGLRRVSVVPKNCGSAIPITVNALPLTVR